MSILGNDLLLGSGDEGYNLTRSLRTRDSASAYLNRTPASAGSATTWTLSMWVKRGKLSYGGGASFASLFGCRAPAAATSVIFGFQLNDTLAFLEGATTYRVTNNVYRDPSAWYHFVLIWDSNNATQANRCRIYVNNIEASYSTNTAITLGATTSVNSITPHTINADITSLGARDYFDGYITEVNFIDGQALTPSSFGETDTTTGVWKPKRYAGTYGTNGFYLPFTDNSALTTSSNVGLGKDFSGNGNYWTTNNISITSGTTYDSMTDVPTLTSATAANFAVLNPLNAETGMGGTLGGGNLDLSGSGGKRSTIAARSGKWYWEFRVNSGAGANFPMSGLYVAGQGTYWPGYDGNSFGYFQGGGIYYNGSTSLTVSSYTDGDVLGFAWDADTGKVYVAKNGTWQNSGDPAAGTGQVATISTGVDRVVGAYNSSGSCSINFGQRPFTYTPPTGYVALNTYNLPTGTILKGNTVMDATLWNGTGASLSVINATSFKPDLVWVKSRSNATDHRLTDSVRGVTLSLATNSTNNEATNAQGLTAFNSNGFTLGTDADYNGSARTFVGWQWQAGQGTTSTNTSGTITSTVSVNASAGFSITTFSTPSGYTTATVGHGLGVAPAMYVVKNRTGLVINWNTYHQSLGNTQALYMNLTNAATTSSTFWNNTSPTSSVLSVGANLYASQPYVVYSWAEIAGFSKFGNYSGNGSADGPFVYTGFRAKWIMIKCFGAAASWVILDSARDVYNPETNALLADNFAAEGSGYLVDFLSNGFKVRNTGSGTNSAGTGYIFAAFAETPTKFALAR